MKPWVKCPVCMNWKQDLSFLTIPDGPDGAALHRGFYLCEACKREILEGIHLLIKKLKDDKLVRAIRRHDSRI